MSTTTTLGRYIDTCAFNWREFFCGWGAAVINVSVTYPLSKLIFRQMLHGIQLQNAFGQMKREGVYYLYRGILPPLCQKSISLSIMFGVYEEVRQPLVQLNWDPYVAKVIGGMVSGTTESILVPFERVQTLLANSHYHDQFRNTVHAFKVLRSYGYQEYYRGLVPILLRNGPSNACFFMLREELQDRINVINNDLLKTSAEFLGGALIGVFLSTIFYPLNVVKIATQNKIGGKFYSPLEVLVQVYRQRGGKIRYLYHGVQMNCTKAFVSWGVMNAAYEHLKELVY
ncbi:mitochondrial nicotinamide adenine dinucleotide transporter SLC25A51 [Anthonomus grandis grandis]|uniref:mitochondrial nicotinamide adenine dinucleotide transporter SLC25A51 n=1 Tax=Anthonomus grandis grandis TaxID=2921223 RepID=UPI002165E81B|nr:mitochondrial nicotinamide adenine dinucleotide transporter SLC25A51 [Anthonomus grandis grandis]